MNLRMVAEDVISLAESMGWKLEGRHEASANQIENFLRRYYDDENLILEAVGEGCNVGNGFPYWVFWFRTSKKG
ncbi:MAG: hypothetical protein M0R48_11860 [Candidatus Omnitrophica bacterium]|nr:hypothetical protein [Candidatus Omnitrophota bacterium]